MRVTATFFALLILALARRRTPGDGYASIPTSPGS